MVQLARTADVALKQSLPEPQMASLSSSSKPGEVIPLIGCRSECGAYSRERFGADCVMRISSLAMPMEERTPTTFSYAMMIVAVIVAGVLMACLTFYVIDLAFDLFNPLFGTVLNVAIIAIFGSIGWKLRFNLYNHLHFLH